MRDAPSIPLITALQDMGATVRVFDPDRHGAGQGRAQGRLLLPTTPMSARRRRDALVIVTEWEQFRALDFRKLDETMAQPVIVDLRNIYGADELARYGFSYTGVGRG